MASRCSASPPARRTPETLLIAEAHQQLEAELVLLARDTRSTHAETADFQNPISERKPFGFRWFVPELLKHRSIWRDVLLASLAIHLVGLATPAVHPGDHRQGDRPPDAQHADRARVWHC
jgi:ABC-type bacteriocin/lantibiotic exporter with double-glycine peptidase domain